MMRIAYMGKTMVEKVIEKRHGSREK